MPISCRTGGVVEAAEVSLEEPPLEGDLTDKRSRASVAEILQLAGRRDPTIVVWLLQLFEA